MFGHTFRDELVIVCSSSFPCLKFFGHNSFCAHVFKIGIGCISKIAFIYKNNLPSKGKPSVSRYNPQSS